MTTSSSGATTWPRCTRCLFSRVLENKRNRPDVRIVDIATRRTPTSERLRGPLRRDPPGTDLALANGILHELVRTGLGRPITLSSKRTSSSSAASKISRRSATAATATGRALHLQGLEAQAFEPRRARSLPGRLHAREGRRDFSGVPATQIRLARLDLWRPATRHGQPLVHGGEPARRAAPG